MAVRKARWLTLVLTMSVGIGMVVILLVVPQMGQAQPEGAGKSRGRLPQSVSVQSAAAADASMFAAPAASADVILSLVGSSVKTPDCYQENKSQTLCFTVYNGSTTGEWIESVRLTFPNSVPGLSDWQVSCNSAFEDPTDSVGYAVNFTCNDSLSYEVFYDTADSDGYGEISNGASWGTCVDVTVPVDYDGPRSVPWVLTGDDIASVDETGSIEIEKCTPLTLRPGQMVITGCNGMAQSLDFELWNVSAGNANVDLVYNAPLGDFTGPTNFQINEGEIITFATQFEPDLCLEVGEEVLGDLTVVAQGSGHSDDSQISLHVSETAGWRRRADSITPTMDSVVVWASHRDGGLWSIGGYGSDGATQRYDPSSNTWGTFESGTVITPLIEYPVDGCYGLDGPNPDTAHEIVVLFPDTLVTESLHVFDITDQRWYTRPIPIFFPAVPTSTYDYIGFWGIDVVSLFNNPVVHDIPDTNMCYLSGGNHEKPGGGTTRNLWRYDPETNGGQYVGDFADSGTVFGFHASWYVPWIGAQGAICVAGGADHNHYIHSSTQCYDIDANSFNAKNADLGTLPERWWGMADGWQITDQGYELWVANGVAQDGTLLSSSAYFREGMSNFEYGPEIPHGLYRLEGDGWNNQFYTLNGSRGGFWYSEFSLHLTPCPTCYRIFSPIIMQND